MPVSRWNVEKTQSIKPFTVAEMTFKDHSMSFTLPSFIISPRLSATDQKSRLHLFYRMRCCITVITGTNKKPVCDFLLLFHYTDMPIFWVVSFKAIARGFLWVWQLVTTTKDPVLHHYQHVKVGRTERQTHTRYRYRRWCVTHHRLYLCRDVA